jgi:hypothetical protein
VGFLFFGAEANASDRGDNTSNVAHKEHTTMSKILSEVLDANARYAANFGESQARFFRQPAVSLF